MHKPVAYIPALGSIVRHTFPSARSERRWTENGPKKRTGGTSFRFMTGAYFENGYGLNTVHPPRKKKQHKGPCTRSCLCNDPEGKLQIQPTAKKFLPPPLSKLIDVRGPSDRTPPPRKVKTPPPPTVASLLTPLRIDLFAICHTHWPPGAQNKRINREKYAVWFIKVLLEISDTIVALKRPDSLEQWKACSGKLGAMSQNAIFATITQGKSSKVTLEEAAGALAAWPLDGIQSLFKLPANFKRSG